MGCYWKISSVSLNVWMNSVFKLWLSFWYLLLKLFFFKRIDSFIISSICLKDSSISNEFSLEIVSCYKFGVSYNGDFLVFKSPFLICVNKASEVQNESSSKSMFTKVEVSFPLSNDLYISFAFIFIMFKNIKLNLYSCLKIISVHSFNFWYH